MAPSEVGARAELAVATALTKTGRTVYLPFFNGHGRVDLVYESADGELRRVQCKTSRLSDGVVSFMVCSNTSNVRKTYAGDVDEFGVYSPELDLVYLVPISDVPRRMAHLRLDPPRNGQTHAIRWAEPYLLRAVP